MIGILYSPEEAGQKTLNSRGKIVKVRKYHLTEKEIITNRENWKKDVSNIDKKVQKKAGKLFFNPYRKGIYYYQIQSMYLLGCNDWHSLNKIVDKIIVVMSEIVVNKEGKKTNAWERFRSKISRTDAVKCKDYIGRIQENMLFFQRLTKLHPAGYKLRQVSSAIDIKRVSKKGFSNGSYSYRLSTYSTPEEALPIRDYKNFEFPRHERKYVNYKFIGKIITRDKIVSEGVVI